VSRSRNIKPGFFTNDQLGECETLARILFAGLWCVADRAGRLEDRPKKLKVALLPFDDCDVTALLDQLEKNGLILRYKAQELALIQVLGFEKHQNPHVKEQASTLPAHGESDASPVQVACASGCSTVQARLIPSSLIPSSLIPDSLVLESANADLSAVPAHLIPKRAACPHTEIISAYHKILPELRQVRQWNEARKKFLARRWAEDEDRQTVDWWREFFGYVRKSRFLMGNVSGHDGRTFQADLEWLVRPTNFVKVIEGKYEDQGA